MLQELALELEKKVQSKYKGDKSLIRKQIEEHLLKNIKLMHLINISTPLKDILRTSEYKNAEKTLLKKVYSTLRQYKNLGQVTPEDFEKKLNVDEAINSHTSTRERINHGKQLNILINKYVKATDSLLDVGGGLLPLILTKVIYDKLLVLSWMDKDKYCANLLEIYNEKYIKKTFPNLKFYIYNKNIKDPWSPILEDANMNVFDVALILKVIPVVKRQEPELIKNLLLTPAKILIISASKESMVKKMSIERRETITLQGFIRASGRTIVEQFETQDEFGYVLR